MTGTKPWHQLPDEDDAWFDRFLIYLHQPTGRRSVRASYMASLDPEKRERFRRNQESTPGYWQERTKEYDWVERAHAYDEDIWAQDEKQAMADRMAIRRRRRSALDKTYGNFEKRLKQVGKGPHKRLIQPQDEDGNIIEDVKPYWKTWYDGVDVDDKTFHELLFKLHNDIRAEYHDAQDKGMQRAPAAVDDKPTPVVDEAEAMTREERLAQIKLLKQDAG